MQDRGARATSRMTWRPQTRGGDGRNPTRVATWRPNPREGGPEFVVGVSGTKGKGVGRVVWVLGTFRRPEIGGNRGEGEMRRDVVSGG